MKSTLLLLAAVALPWLPGCADEPSAYDASTPVAAPSAVPTAAIPSAADPSAVPSAPAPADPGGAPDDASGQTDVSGLRQFCERYDRSSVSRYVGMEVCYNVEMTQSGSALTGTGYKSFETTAGSAGRDLDPSEQSPIRLTGSISGQTIRLDYAVEGASRTTRGSARIDAGRTARTDDGGNPNWGGTFRSDAAGASGQATLTAWALRD